MSPNGEMSKIQNMMGWVCRQDREHEESTQDFGGEMPTQKTKKMGGHH